jgi:DNA replicative helicase MCM subunit Mcm2 (Cdc46/Mcm family)
MEAIMDAQSDRFESGKKKIVIDKDLQTHIACAKSIKEIKFEPGVRDIFKQFFRDMKKLEAHMGGVKITNRMFNGLWRQAIARAVLHLRDTVTKQDAEVAIKHLTEVLAKIGIDAQTGEVNVDKITGDPKARQKKLSLFKTIMTQAQGSRSQDVSEEVLLQILQQVPQYKKKEDALQLLNEAKESDMIRSTRPGWWILL